MKPAMAKTVLISGTRLVTLAFGMLASLIFVFALIATGVSVASGSFSIGAAVSAGVAWLVAVFCRQVFDAMDDARAHAEMELAEPDWAAVVLDEGERRLAKHKGWLVSGTYSDPCELFLTDRRLFFRIVPFTLTQGGTAPIDLTDIKECEVRPDGQGKPRLLVAANSIHAPEAWGAFAVDLRPVDDPDCWSFADRVMNAVEARTLQIAHAQLAGEPAPLEEEWSRKSAYERRLAELGSGPDEALIQKIRKELGYGPLTPAPQKKTGESATQTAGESQNDSETRPSYEHLPGVSKDMKRIWAERDARRKQGDTPG